ncbi:MAG TPA: hypothetical protein VN764_01405, partial [Polyangiaceae bacterium]|nr:hypothetical protein [Polyangiaceae bacterium]
MKLSRIWLMGLAVGASVALGTGCSGDPDVDGQTGTGGAITSPGAGGTTTGSGGVGTGGGTTADGGNDAGESGGAANTGGNSASGGGPSGSGGETGEGSGGAAPIDCDSDGAVITYPTLPGAAESPLYTVTANGATQF